MFRNLGYQSATRPATIRDLQDRELDGTDVARMTVEEATIRKRARAEDRDGQERALGTKSIRRTDAQQ
ncbi:MAG: hypothetical protein M3Y73_21060 [Actinomycetota bacterium]|nr:hypothetical protein [Actinomycetota bacterium]